MPPAIPRFKALLALLTWVCVCATVVVVWSPLPPLNPPLPSTPPPSHPTPVLQGYPPPPPPSYYAHKEEEEEEEKKKREDRGGGEEEEAEKRNKYDYRYNEEEEEEEDVEQYYDYEEEEEDRWRYIGPGYETWGQYNVTPSNARLLIYNRIPKCASSTMQTILRWCSRRLGYQHLSSEVYDQHRLDSKKRQELVHRLTTATTASTSQALISYDRHFHYVNFTAEGARRRPAYINVVREPVERFISSFYYRRSRERLARISAHGHLTVPPSPNWLNRTVEQCVLSGDSECSFSTGTQQEMILTYFCGHQDVCRTVGSKRALQMAKDVVSREYSVVGLVAHMERSLRLMETLVPVFLEGAFRSYSIIKKKRENVNRNTEKPRVEREVRRELRRRMAHDIDFYDFLRQRLFLQARTFLGE